MSPEGFETRNFSKRSAADLRLRPRGHWDRPQSYYFTVKREVSKMLFPMWFLFSSLLSLEFFIDIKSFRSHYGPGVDSASNRNEYQEHFLGGKGGRCVRLTTLPPFCAVVTKSGILNFLEPSGPLGTAIAQWLRCCATNRKVAGSIPAGVSGFFIDIKSF